MKRTVEELGGNIKVKESPESGSTDGVGDERGGGCEEERLVTKDEKDEGESPGEGKKGEEVGKSSFLSLSMLRSAPIFELGAAFFMPRQLIGMIGTASRESLKIPFHNGLRNTLGDTPLSKNSTSTAATEAAHAFSESRSASAAMKSGTTTTEHGEPTSTSNAGSTTSTIFPAL